MKGNSLPNFILVGAPRCGTTALFQYLGQHPDIYLPRGKELHYFSYEYLKENSKGPGDDSVLAALPATFQEYKAYYVDIEKERAIGEISPSYLYWSDSSERILAELGRVKIIITLRDPVDRAFSQYMHLVSTFRETLGFYDALMEEQHRKHLHWGDIWWYAEHSLYTDKVEKYISVFGTNNVKVIIFEDFIHDKSKALRDLFEFLEVDTDFICDTSRRYNVSGVPHFRFIRDLLTKPNIIKTAAKKIIPGTKIQQYIAASIQKINKREKPEMDSRSRTYLVEYCKHDVERLNALLDRQLPWMSGSTSQ